MTLEQAMSAAAACQASGRLDQAEAIYRQVLAQQPNFPDALNRLGIVAAQTNRASLALDLIGRAVAIAPNFAGYHSNLGLVLDGLGRWSQAIDQYRQALALDPNLADAHCNLGNALRQAGDLPGALDHCQRALKLRSNFPMGCNNLAMALYAGGRFDEAILYFRRAISLQPDFALAHQNLGGLLLTVGQFAEGWTEHEWRWRSPQSPPPGRELRKPLWDGSDLGSRRILVQFEQGLGDAIQFARYAKLVAARGGKVIFRSPRETLRLFQTLYGVEELIGPDQPLPAFDVHCPVLSLPAMMRTSLQNIPADVPYLRADPQLQQTWQTRLSSVSGLKVGLAWAGRPSHSNDRNRSIPLQTLTPLAAANVLFVSLQKGAAAEQVRRASGGLKIIDWTDDLNDLADTAALIANLDLIITVDTAIAHLAGALGKPVWVLLPFVPDWRWMLQRNDSPWYPSMRLFRQPRIGDWQTPIEQIVEALKMFNPTAE